MTEFVLILLSTILVNNVVLVQFLGLCPFMGVSGKLETALDLEFLRTISFILVIAVVVQFTEMVVHKTSPLLYRVLGIFLPLITTNCAVLGVALLITNREGQTFMTAATYGFGAALGFSMVLVLFAGLRERIAIADVPVPFRGAAIGMITAGLMSLAFMGFTGLIRI